MINIEQYKLHSELTKEILRKNNFTYSYSDGYYLYHFPVYKYKKEAIIWCNLYIGIDSSSWNFTVVDQNNNTYAPFFNRVYGGRNRVVENIERKINSQLNMFIKNNILKKKERK